MPWNLTTPVDPGDIDPAGPYSQVKIVGFRHDSKRGMIAMQLEYGNTVDSEWVSGVAPSGSPTSVKLSGQGYADFVSANQAAYDQVASLLYGWLAANGHVAEGSAG